MLNFDYSIPTEIFFGKGQIEVLRKEIKKYGKKVLLVYGKGSIKRSGVYDQVVNILKEENIPFEELSGVEPNPTLETVKKGIKMCRENEIDFLLPVGGGSTIDCSKAIAAGYYYDGDPWDLVIGKAKVKDVLPVGVVLTIAATGSEMDATAVITNMETKQKIGLKDPKIAPKFSIMDPTYTFSVSERQTASGTADIMSHTLENYFSRTKSAYLQDKLAEGVLKTCIKYGVIAVKEPDNYEARANLMWASSLAINGLLSYGKDASWTVHPIEHELSAYYNVTHGIGLAILTPYWMEYVLNDDTLYKFVEYGINVWNIDKNEDEYNIAHRAIEKTKEYFNLLGIPSALREVGIGEENLENMAKGAVKNRGVNGKVGSFVPLAYEDILNIYKKAL